MRPKPTAFECLLLSLEGQDASRPVEGALSTVCWPDWPARNDGPRARRAYDPDDGPCAAPPLDEAAERDAVRRALDLSRPRTAPEWRALRRRFAAANHPDGAPAWLRPRRLLRMAIANALIDEALERLRTA